MQIYNYPNLFPVDTVMNTTLNSKAMQIQNQLFYAIQIVWTGTPTGTFKLQGSADNSATLTAAGQVPYTPTNWTDIPSSSEAVAAAGSYMWNESFQAYNFVRVVYTDGSGGSSTATITASTFNAKG
jgi:hypothetical protein